MPLTWGQVRAGLEPKPYTLRNVPELLSRNRVWEDYGEASRPLDVAISKLVGNGS